MTQLNYDNISLLSMTKLVNLPNDDVQGILRECRLLLGSKLMHLSASLHDRYYDYDIYLDLGAIALDLNLKKDHIFYRAVKYLDELNNSADDICNESVQTLRNRTLNTYYTLEDHITQLSKKHEYKLPERCQDNLAAQKALASLKLAREVLNTDRDTAIAAIYDFTRISLLELLSIQMSTRGDNSASLIAGELTQLVEFTNLQDNCFVVAFAKEISDLRRQLSNHYIDSKIPDTREIGLAFKRGKYIYDICIAELCKMELKDVEDPNYQDLITNLFK